MKQRLNNVDMWNWLMDCYQEKSLTLLDLYNIMEDDEAAKAIWRDWASEPNEFINFVRGQALPLLEFLTKQKKGDEN
jgi:hypothetical protein